MMIRSMTATFGKLEQTTLTLSPGLNILSAPNEGGKSTWVSFLTAMLYGIDTRERDKTGYLAPKTRYQPWSGAPMYGELCLEWQGEDITLRRFATRTTPFGGFEAVYTATGDPVPFLTPSHAGETLTGVSREVFLRCALVGQGDTAISSAPDLERRIAALATTGEEHVSFSATQRTLKDWRNRRQSNRSTGMIPQLMQRLTQTAHSLDQAAQARSIQTQARQQLEQLHSQQKELEQLLEQEQAYHQQTLYHRYCQAVEQLNQCSAALEHLPPPDPRWAGLTPAQAVEQTHTQFHTQPHDATQRAQVKARRHRLTRAAGVLVPLFGIGGLLLVILGFFLPMYPLSFLGFGSMVAAVIAAIICTVKIGNCDRLLHTLTASTAQKADDATALQQYLAYVEQKQQLEQQLRYAQERVVDLQAQGAHLPTATPVSPPQVDATALTAQLHQVNAQITQWQSRLDQATGALGSDTLDTESYQGELTAQLRQRQEEYAALTLALEGLEDANATLRQRFSPTLNESAGRLFSHLTGGVHQEVTLSRDFSAQATQSGISRPYSQLFLSTGTQEQLYLALRLALCDLTAPDVPLILDDTFSNFDDTRATQALELLQGQSRTRQILLFSCHCRDAQWGTAHGAAVTEL